MSMSIVVQFGRQLAGRGCQHGGAPVEEQGGVKVANDVAGFIHSWPENTMKTAKSISLDQFVDKQSSNVSQHTKSCVFKQRFVLDVIYLV